MKTKVVIIGAGPAGSVAGYELARLGVDVTIIEMKNPIGVPVICGEFVPYYEELEDVGFKIDGLKEIYEKFIDKPDIVVNRTDTIELSIENGKKFVFPYDGFIVDKDRMLQEIVKSAQDNGAKVLIGRRAISVNYDNGKYLTSVYLNDNIEIIESEYLVGADGLRGIVAKSLNFNNGFTKMDEALTCNQKMINVNSNPRVIKMILTAKLAPGGYGWIIPKGNKEANVGIGIRGNVVDKYNVHKLQKLFISSLPELVDAKISSPLLCKFIPVGGLAKEFIKDKAVLLGDAAGAVMPTNGGGIVPAMATGLIYAQEFIKDPTLNTFTKRMKREIGDFLGFSLEYRKIADELLFDAQKLRRYTSYMSTNLMRDIVACRKNRFILTLAPLIKLMLRIV
ncbi:MAG: geranylgeranyl reductase family protein [Thermoprotei archaeon]|jgi:digeranylgeranylglycerophospholipid reductase